jgi:hypothetical protein
VASSSKTADRLVQLAQTVEHLRPPDRGGHGKAAVAGDRVEGRLGEFRLLQFHEDLAQHDLRIHQIRIDPFRRAAIEQGIETALAPAQGGGHDGHHLGHALGRVGNEVEGQRPFLGIGGAHLLDSRIAHTGEGPGEQFQRVVEPFQLAEDLGMRDHAAAVQRVGDPVIGILDDGDGTLDIAHERQRQRPAI